MLEGLGSAFLEPSHNLPRVAARAGAKSTRSNGRPRRVHSDSEALCSSMSGAIQRHLDEVMETTEMMMKQTTT